MPDTEMRGASIDAPADLWFNCKLAALTHRKTLREWVIEALREKLEREKGKA